ncbi:hypothetical protein V2J09_023553 [Rumex salicifolius]
MLIMFLFSSLHLQPRTLKLASFLSRQPIPPSLSAISLPLGTFSLQSAMSSDCSSAGETVTQDDSKLETLTLIYPTPLSPPLSSLSKEVELSRAMSASARSSLFSLSRDDVVFEDEWLIVVNKPPGIYCENVLSSIPRLLQSSPISEHLGKASEAAKFHLANRLDRDTSGVMVITKSHKVAAKLVKAFTDHKVKKTYIALCAGSIPKWDRIRIKSGHGRSKFGAWRVYALSDVGKTLPGGSSVRDMETLFEVISVNGEDVSREVLEPSVDTENVIVVEGKSEVETEQVRDEIMVRAYPRSGRTHQIRLHCQHLGIPIMGDVKYHGVNEWKGSVCDGHRLHAESLSFDHPITGVPVLIRAPLPLWASQVS